MKSCCFHAHEMNVDHSFMFNSPYNTSSTVPQTSDRMCYDEALGERVTRSLLFNHYFLSFHSGNNTITVHCLLLETLGTIEMGVHTRCFDAESKKNDHISALKLEFQNGRIGISSVAFCCSGNTRCKNARKW